VTDGPSGVGTHRRSVECMRAGGAPGHSRGVPRRRRDDGAPSGTRPTPGTGHRSAVATGHDARLAKGARTRQVVLEALVALIDERSPQPTVPDVAARAGVSVRIVYHHFGGIQELLVSAVALQSDRHRDLVFTIPPRGPVDLRITALCRQRRMYFEEVSPVFRMALARAHDEAALHALLADDRAVLRAQLAATLAPELAARQTGSTELLDALAHATGWDAWRSLRDAGGRTAPSAERMMTLTAARLMG